MTFAITSSAFRNRENIPPIHTCDGANISPPLSWSGVPVATKSLALIVDDPDAPDPDAAERTWVHWVMYNIPPSSTELPPGDHIKNLPQGVQEGLNDWKNIGYGGPCPPKGRHRYFHKIYALDVMLPDLVRPTKVQLENAMQDHIIAQAELVGLYQRK